MNLKTRHPIKIRLKKMTEEKSFLKSSIDIIKVSTGIYGSFLFLSYILERL